jgi:hypothetical protein
VCVQNRASTTKQASLRCEGTAGQDNAQLDMRAGENRGAFLVENSADWELADLFPDVGEEG